MQQSDYPPDPGLTSRELDAFLREQQQPAPGYGIWLILIAFYLLVAAIQNGWWVLTNSLWYLFSGGASRGPIGIKTIEDAPYLMPYTLFALFLGVSALSHFKRRSEITPFLIASCLVLHLFYLFMVLFWWSRGFSLYDLYFFAPRVAIVVGIILYLFLSKHVGRVFRE